MSDSDGATGQDGATDITKERFDGLMSSYQRALAENRSLKEQMASAAAVGQATSPPATGEPGDGFIVGDDGQLEPWTPPRVLGNNPKREPPVTDDGSARYTREQLAKQGFASRRTNWP